MSVPKVSIVMSVYNGEQHLAKSLDSLLAQTFTDWELIVINDGSKDSSLSILNKYADKDTRLRVIDQENTGLTKALIRGCHEARGEYIARQDGDDWSHSQRLQKQVELIENQPQVSMACCFADYVDDAGELIQRVDRPTNPDEATRGLIYHRQGPPAHGTVMFRKRDYEQAGGYRACFYYGQDADLWLRLVNLGKVAYVPEYLYSYRISLGQISTTQGNWQHQFGELGQEAHAARMRGESEEPFLEQAAELCRQLKLAKENPRVKKQLQSAALYRMGTMLSRQGNRRCRDYFWSAIKLNPWHWKSWCRLTLDYVQAERRSRPQPPRQ